MVTPVFGNDLRHMVRAQAAFDTFEAFVAGDALQMIDLKIEPTLEFHEIKEHAGSPSLQGEIEGKRGGRWEAKFYVKPNAAGTAPDAGAILAHALGTETVVPATSVTYTLSAAIPSGLQIARISGTSLYEVISGAWVEKLEVEIKGNDEPVITASGGFARYGYLKGSPVNGAAQIAVAATTCVMSAGSAWKVGVGAVLDFAGNNNSGTGYRVTAVAADGITLTFTPALAGALVPAAAAINAFMPAGTVSGSIQGGIACDASIGGTSVGFIEYKAELQTGITGLDKEATVNRVNRLGRGERRVMGSLNAYFLDETATIQGNAWNGAVAAVNVRAGPATAAQRMTCQAPAARLGVASVDVPEAEEAVFTSEWKARQAAAANDEFSILFN